MLRIIASNFLKIANGWAIVVKYATTVVYVGTHFFSQFLEGCRSHSSRYNLISSKKHGPSKWDWWFYVKYAWYYLWPSELREVWVLGLVDKKRTRKWKVKQKISKTSNLWLKIGVFIIFSFSFHFTVYFPVTRIALK